MTRENSSFKFHILLANCCRRQAALFTLSLVSLLAALPVGMILTIQTMMRYQWDNTDPLARSRTVQDIQSALLAQHPANVVLIALAVVAGIAMFRYLHSRSQTDFFCALPIRRGQMFAIRVTAGMLAVLPAYVLGVVLTCGVCAAYGFGDAIDTALLLYSILLHIAGFLLVYAVTILAAILCGHTVVSLLVCGWLQFGLVVGWYLVRGLLAVLYPAQVYIAARGILWLSPPIALFRMASNIGDVWTEQTSSVLVTALGCFAAAAVIFALNYVLCRIRNSENAGLSIAFPVIELPFKLYMVSLVGIACGLVFEVTSGDWPTMFLGIALGGAVCTCVVEIVYDQDFHSLFRRWKSTLVFAAVAAVVLGCMAMDITHWNSRLPDREDIAAVHMTSNMHAWNCGVGDESEMITAYSYFFGIPIAQKNTPDQTIMLESQENIDTIYDSASLGAQAMRTNRSTIKEDGSEFQVTFQLKDGSTFQRVYYLPYETEQIEQNSAKVRFSEEYLNTCTAIAQAEKQKNQVTELIAGNYVDISSEVSERLIDNATVITDILETLKQESLSITQEYAETHAPVAVLRAITQQVDENRTEHVRQWDFYSTMDGVYDIPIYECETKTLARLKLYAKGFATGFGEEEITSIVSYEYNEDGTRQEVVHTDPEEIAEWKTKLIPSQMDTLIDPVCLLNYDQYDVELADGRTITCITYLEDSDSKKEGASTSSVGVIGGADGPTEILVTDTASGGGSMITVILLGVGIVVVVLAALLLYQRKKHK